MVHFCYKKALNCNMFSVISWSVMHGRGSFRGARRAENKHRTFRWHELSSASVKIALGVFTHSKGRPTVSTLLYFPSQVRTY